MVAQKHFIVREVYNIFKEKRSVKQKVTIYGYIVYTFFLSWTVFTAANKGNSQER
jgi:acid stress-induced BolA-like protein IbaG/YrbA